MTVTSLDHVNIRSRDLNASVAFYSEVLGMTADVPPPPSTERTARWMRDARGQAIIHLRFVEEDLSDGGAVDHVALVCTGKIQLLARLDGQAAAYRQFDGGGRSVVFVRDPHGVMLELNFIGE